MGFALWDFAGQTFLRMPREISQGSTNGEIEKERLLLWLARATFYEQTQDILRLLHLPSGIRLTSLEGQPHLYVIEGEAVHVPALLEWLLKAREKMQEKGGKIQWSFQDSLEEGKRIQFSSRWEF